MSRSEASQSSWVTLQRYTYPHEAHPLKLRLESEGIRTFLADAHTIGVDPLLSIATGGVRLQVPIEQIEEAQAIMNSEFVSESEIPERRRCPDCSSEEVHYTRITKNPFLLAIIVLGIPLPFLTRKWVCRSCNYQWDAR